MGQCVTTELRGRPYLHASDLSGRAIADIEPPALATAEWARATAPADDQHGSPTGPGAARPSRRKQAPHDLAVSGALRRVLVGPPAGAMTTFVRNSSHVAGALSVRRSDPAPHGNDPFIRLLPARLLRVESGALRRVGPPPGPVTQQYAALPWPAAGF